MSLHQRIRLARSLGYQVQDQPAHEQQENPSMQDHDQMRQSSGMYGLSLRP